MSGMTAGGLSTLIGTAMLLASLGGAGVTPKETLRFRGVQEQMDDRTCGYAVLATLLSDYYQIRVSETDLIDRYGWAAPLSFLDMQSILESYDLQATGYRLPASEVQKVHAAYGPVVLHLTRPYEHFVLLLWVADGWYLLGDPAVGAVFLDERSFIRRWSGVALVVAGQRPSPTGPSNFDESARLERMLWHAYR